MSLGGFDSAMRGFRVSRQWRLQKVLGDSITRRMVAAYKSSADLQAWRSVVPSIVPINDFRTQRITRMGGYGLLPAVNQGAPYQSLTSPTDEEATYALIKRGGTEDLTLEAVANDDVHKILQIPQSLRLPRRSIASCGTSWRRTRRAPSTRPPSSRRATPTPTPAQR